MSRPVHYDVERTLADLHAGWAAYRLGPDAEACEKIALAHRAVFGELIRMTLQSENNGYTNIDVLEAGQMLLADWLVFMMSVYREDDKQFTMCRVFLNNTYRGVVARKSSKGADQTVELWVTSGGHA